MKFENIPADIKSKSLKEAKDEIYQILSKLENQEGNLEDYQREKCASILLASHNMAEVERLCSSVLMMNSGIIIDKEFFSNIDNFFTIKF